MTDQTVPVDVRDLEILRRALVGCIYQEMGATRNAKDALKVVNELLLETDSET